MSALNHAGEGARLAGELEQARDLYRQAVAIGRSQRNWVETGLVEGNLAHVLLALGEIDEAERLWRGRLDRDGSAITPRAIAHTLEGLAAVAEARGRLAPAARLLGAADALRDRIRWPRDPADRVTLAALEGKLVEALGPAGFREARERGRAMPAKEVLEEARGGPGNGLGNELPHLPDPVV